MKTKKEKRERCFFTLAVASLFLIYTTSAISGNDWTKPVKIKAVTEQSPLSTAGYSVNVETAADAIPSPTLLTTTCSSKTGFYFTIGSSDEHGKRMFSMLLSAHTSGKDVRLYVVDGQCHPWGIAKIDGVIVQD